MSEYRSPKVNFVRFAGTTAVEKVARIVSMMMLNCPMCSALRRGDASLGRSRNFMMECVEVCGYVKNHEVRSGVHEQVESLRSYRALDLDRSALRVSRIVPDGRIWYLSILKFV